MGLAGQASHHTVVAVMPYLADQLHNLVEVILLLKHLTHSLPDVYKVRVKAIIEWLQRLQQNQIKDSA